MAQHNHHFDRRFWIVPDEILIIGLTYHCIIYGILIHPTVSIRNVQAFFVDEIPFQIHNFSPQNHGRLHGLLLPVK